MPSTLCNIPISIQHHCHYSHIKYPFSKNHTNWIEGSFARPVKSNHLLRQQAALSVSGPAKEENGASMVVQIHIYDQAIEYLVAIDALRMGTNGGHLRTVIICLTDQCHEMLHTVGIEDLPPSDDLMMCILVKPSHIMTAFLHVHRQEPSIEVKAPQVLHRTAKTEDHLEMSNSVGMNDLLATTNRVRLVVVAAAAAAMSIHISPHTQLHNPTKDVLLEKTGTANNRQGGTMETAIAIETGTEGEIRTIAFPLLLRMVLSPESPLPPKIIKSRSSKTTESRRSNMNHKDLC